MLVYSVGYCDRVEVASRNHWPHDGAEQEAVLRGIHSREWSRMSEAELIEEGYLLIDRLNLETRRGLRKFNVWLQPPEPPIWNSPPALIARQCEQGRLVVTSALKVMGATIEASFHMLSGELLGSVSFEITATQQELYLSNLKEAATELALDQDVLESKQQRLQLLLQGFSQALPGEFLVWEGEDITQEALERRLSHLLRGVAAQ